MDACHIVFVSHQVRQHSPTYTPMHTPTYTPMRTPTRRVLTPLPSRHPRQWKSAPHVGQPDPTNADFDAIVAAINSLIAAHKTLTDPNKILVWIECASRPAPDARLEVGRLEVGRSH